MNPLSEYDNRIRIVLDDGYEIVDPAETTHDQASNPDLAMFSDSSSSYDTMNTIHSDEVASYFRSVHGSLFPSDENAPPIIPTGVTADRLDLLLHIIIRLSRRGKNVPDVVDKMLRDGGIDEEGSGARVLDVVTNSGAWVNETAEIYPTATFTSIDFKPLVPHVPHPRIDFQVYNFQAGIMEPDNTFDLVHIRQGVIVTNQFNFLLRELHRVLKPNGYIVITEFPFDVYEGNDPSTPLRPSHYYAQMVKLGLETCKAESVDIAAWQDMSARLEPSHSLWQDQPAKEQHILDSNKASVNTQSLRGFYGISMHREPIPLGAWHPDEYRKTLGTLLQSYTFQNVCSSLPVTTERVRSGMGESQPHEFVEKLLEELRDIANYQAFAMLHTWLARKLA
ncbi:methyltransferase domain protein [Ceratobasidium sp. AG-Ba]|nr:methyltransferase domain protein [Ceratobasidium sp. AG-Ba]